MRYEFLTSYYFPAYINKTSKQAKHPRSNISNNKIREFFKDFRVCGKLLTFTVCRSILFNLDQFDAVRLFFCEELY